MILALALAFFAAPETAGAQPAEGPIRLGFLPLGSPSNSYDQSTVEAFRQDLREAGLVENRHVIVDLVWVTNESEYPAAVSGLVERGAKVLVPAGSSNMKTAKTRGLTVPQALLTRADDVVQ